MDTADCYRLGNITKMWGTRGQVAMYLDVDCPADYATLDSAFLLIKGHLVPHFFRIDQLNGNRAIATFEDTTPDQAALLVGCDMYLPLTMLPKLEGNKFYFHEVVGFAVVDSHHGLLGTLQQVIEYPAQPLFQIMQGDTEILIPVIDQVIDRVDREGRTLYITAPNGLVELYVGEKN